MSRPSSGTLAGAGGRSSMGSSSNNNNNNIGGAAAQGSASKHRSASQTQQRTNQGQSTGSPRAPYMQTGSGPASNSSRNASPAPAHANAGNKTMQRQAPSRAASSGAGAASASASASSSSLPDIIADMNALLSKPVLLTLDGGQKQEAGLLWAFDADMGIVALEVPKTAIDSVAGRSSAAAPYPTMAASFPTSILATVKVAAQGGDASGPRTNFSMISLRRIQRVEALTTASATVSNDGAAQDLSTAQPTAVDRDVNVAAAEAREKAATTEALKRASKIGTGVSKLGQDVFDALNKTLPCRWADRHIIVMDEIVISPDKYDAAVVPDIPLATLQTLADGGSVVDAPNDAKAKATRWQRVSKVLAGERRRILGASV